MALIRPLVDLPGHRMLILDAEAWVACLPRDHRLASRDEVEIAELLDDPIVCAPMSAGMWRDYWLAMDARGRREPTIAAVPATYEAETTCIARGLGNQLHDRGKPGSTTGRASCTCRLWTAHRVTPRRRGIRQP